MDTLADSFSDKLINKLYGSQLYGSQLQIPRRASPFLSPIAGSRARVQAAQANLRSFGIGSSSLENLALSAIDANNRGRDLSVKAQKAEMVSGWSTVDA